MTKLHPFGVFSAALTPFKADLTPDHAAFVAHAKKLIADGCDGIAMLGTTGEANSLSARERMALLEATLAGGIAPSQLLPGTGVAAFTETVELTRHALSVGVETVVMLPPYYYKGVSDDGIVAAYSAIIERIGDARLKVVLYHIPPMSQVPLSFAVVERLRELFPATIVGIKDSSGDFDNMSELVARFPGLAVLAGADPLMLPLLRKGGAGCITATSNICAADLAVVFRHAADPAREAEVEAAQKRVVAARNAVSKHAQIASLKAIMAARTGNEAWRHPRPPLMALSREAAAEVLSLVEAPVPA
jgi:4-hydroxy-tetrahydrodipicolinate synthase